jgi:hypothetical protein
VVSLQVISRNANKEIKTAFASQQLANVNEAKPVSATQNEGKWVNGCSYY